VRIETHKILKVRMKEYRVRSVQKIQVSECEEILEMLLNRKYVIGPGVNQTMVDQVDWSQPNYFSKRGDAVSVSFDHKNKGSGFFDLQIKTGKKELTIIQLVQAVF
ncbi:MAG: hypothetical protein VX438_15225, partial [Planctomycetota bacterium]|nr:hypothetical protein [Planctomycetota bacterium]